MFFELFLKKFLKNFDLNYLNSPPSTLNLKINYQHKKDKKHNSFFSNRIDDINLFN